MVGVGSDSFGVGWLLDIEQLGDGDDLTAGGAAAAFAEASGEQVAVRAAAFAGEALAAAGAFVDAAGGP